MSNVRIDRLFNFEKGNLQSSKCEPGEYDFITASSEWKTHKEYTFDCEALVFAAAASGSLGRTHYVNGKFIASDLCFIMTPKNEKEFPIDLKFYHILFNALKTEIVKNTKAGTSKEAIGLSSFGRYELPYIEIERQIEIKNQFVAAAGVKEELSFEFLRQQNFVSQLCQAFLREAMHGKLVKQDKKDGNAKDLLRQIKAEKARSEKKEKEISPINPEEIPFEIPNNWVWCRLGEIAYIASGSTPSKEAFVSVGVPYLKMYNLKNQKIAFDYRPQFIKEEVHNGQLKRSRTQVGDLIMNIVGPPLGKLAIIPESLPEANFNQAGVLIRPYLFKEINSWLFYYLNELSEINSISTKGVAGQDNISITQSNNMKIPLPPLGEQRRMIKKLEQIMHLSEELQKSIAQSKEQNEMLLKQVLREALQPKEVEV